ncbi:MAG TPA: hypothetical protein VLT45_01725 [Kofleriaceae bacterium]|nr:hypothetical protein [Kofleriaceae bacterium]
MLREALPGVRDLRVLEYLPPDPTQRAKTPPHPEIRGWTCRVPRLGHHDIAGAWKLPTTAEQIVADARREIDRAIRLRDREMVYEKPLEQAIADDEAAA